MSDKYFKETENPWICKSKKCTLHSLWMLVHLFYVRMAESNQNQKFQIFKKPHSLFREKGIPGAKSSDEIWRERNNRYDDLWFTEACLNIDWHKQKLIHNSSS